MICHAYNMQGQKCDLTYEHEDNHEFTIQWTNDECWTPGREIIPKDVLHTEASVWPPPPALEVESMGPVPDYREGRAGTCLMCSHTMHHGECPSRGCDCKTGIPA